MKKLTFIFLLFTALVLFMVTPGINLRYSKALVLGLSMIIFLSMRIENIWIKLFLIWTVIRSFFGFNSFTFDAVFFITLGCLSYQGMVDLFKTKETIKAVLNSVCVLAIIQTIMLILQWKGIWAVVLPCGNSDLIFATKLFSPASVAGFFDNRNVSGAFLLLCLPAFFRKKWMYYSSVVLIGMHLSNSTASFIPAFMIIVLYFIITMTKERDLCAQLQLFTVICVAVVLLMIIQKGGLEEFLGVRYKMWSYLIKTGIPRHWVIGWGPGQFKAVMPMIFDGMKQTGQGSWLQAHNEYLQLWFEHGIVGIILLCGFVFTTLKKVFKKIIIGNLYMYIAFCGVIAGLINSGANFMMHSTVAVFWILWLAMIEAEG